MHKIPPTPFISRALSGEELRFLTDFFGNQSFENVEVLLLEIFFQFVGVLKSFQKCGATLLLLTH